MKIELSELNLDRLFIINQVKEGLLTQREAGKQMSLSSRQVRRLLQRVQLLGALGIKPRHRGGNRSFPDAFRQQVLLSVRNHYQGFGPTLAKEKLESEQGVAAL